MQEPPLLIPYNAGLAHQGFFNVYPSG